MTCRCTPDSDLCTHCHNRQQAAEYTDADNRLADHYADRMVHAGWE